MLGSLYSQGFEEGKGGKARKEREIIRDLVIYREKWGI